MVRLRFLLIPALMAVPLAAQQGMRGGCCAGQGMGPASQAPIASNPVVELSGNVGEIHIARGQGTPYLEVKQGNVVTKVYLGPMHYLISNDFSPKTGQDISVKGYKQNDTVVAKEVTLEKKTLKFRDDQGRPLWRGGPRRGGAGRMMGRPPAPQE
jgi:hypothetical protein